MRNYSCHTVISITNTFKKSVNYPFKSENGLTQVSGSRVHENRDKLTQVLVVRGEKDY